MECINLLECLQNLDGVPEQVVDLAQLVQEQFLSEDGPKVPKPRKCPIFTP